MSASNQELNQPSSNISPQSAPQNESDDMPRFFRRQPRTRYHFPDDLRIAVLADDDEALMRLAAHLQSCPECQERQFGLVDQLSEQAVRSDEPGTVARASSLQAEPAMREREPGMVQRATEVSGGDPEAAERAATAGPDAPGGISCATARVALFRYLEQDREMPHKALQHLRECEVCGAHLTDAALTRYTKEMHGEEELPAIG